MTNKYRHMKNKHSPTCDRCGSNFENLRLMKHHRKLCEGRPVNEGASTSGAQRAVNEGASTSSSHPNQEPRNIQQPPPQPHLIAAPPRQIVNQNIQPNEMVGNWRNRPRNRHHRLLPGEENDEWLNFFEEEGLAAAAPEVQQMFRRNFGAINDYHRPNRHLVVHNFRVRNGDLLEFLNSNRLQEVFEGMDTAFKIDASLGMILESNQEDAYRYFHSSHNYNTLFPRPVAITDRPSYDAFLRQLRDIDFVEKACENRPDSRWVLHRVTNITVYLYLMPDFPIRAGNVILPTRVVNNRSLISMQKSTKGRPFSDHLCAYRCMAYHKDRTMADITRRAQLLEREHYESQPFVDNAEMKPTINNLHYMEHAFDVSIYVYELTAGPNGEDCAILRRRPPIRREDVAYFHLYKDHFSYITNIDEFTKTYRCDRCCKLWHSRYKMERHFATCNDKTEVVHPRIVHTKPKNVFDELSDLGIALFDDSDTYYPYRLCWDCEVYFDHDELPSSTANMKIQAKHCLASISITSNVPEFDEPVTIVSDGDERAVVYKAMDYMIQVSDKAAELMEERYEAELGLLDGIEEYAAEQESEAIKAMCEGDDKMRDKLLDKLTEKKTCVINKLKCKLIAWMKNLVCFSYNGTRYDQSIVKEHMISYIEENIEGGVDHVVKRGNCYKSIACRGLTFLDVISYLPAGTSYSNYLKAMRVSEEKFYWPYEYFTSLDVLRETQLPPREAFYSSLTESTITEGEYQRCLDVWNEKKFSTMRDHLIYYNELDVVGMLSALQVHARYFREMGLCLSKDAISLPGLAAKYMYSCMPEGTFLTLFKAAPDLYDKVKEGVRGGISMIFNRYQEKGVTKIREEDYGANAKTCQSVLGMDCSSMYLAIIYGEQPVGHYIYRERDSRGQFSLKRSVHGASLSAAEWMEWVAKEKGIRISHMFNDGVEAKLGDRQLPVDGLCRETNTVYQFHGCYWHAHACWCNTNMPCKTDHENQLRREMTRRNEAYITGLGYNIEVIRECEWRQKKIQLNLQSQCSAMHKQFFPDVRSVLTEEQILAEVKSGDMFGIVECDIRVPEGLRERFKDFQPIIKHTTISKSAEDIGEHMSAFCGENKILSTPRRTLIASWFAEKHLIASELLQWYLQQGFEVTKVHYVAQFNKSRCFKAFAERVMKERRAADKDSSLKVRSDCYKMVANSAAGRTLIDRAKFVNVKFIDQTDGIKISQEINTKVFKRLEYLEQANLVEVESFKKRILIDNPITIGFLILERSKLLLLKFCHVLLHKYLPRDSYCLLECDTDSMYIALTENHIFPLVPAHLRQEFEAEYASWFAVDYCPDHARNFFDARYNSLEWDSDACEQCKEATAYDVREVGKFHLECQAEGFVGLCPKSYYCSGEKDKFSAKGVSKRTNNIMFSDFKDVLTTQKSKQVVNKGFRVMDGKMYTYNLKKAGLTYFYGKRIVGDDGITTYPTNL